MNTLEAMQAMMAGKKVRKIDWNEFSYLHLKNNIIVNNENDPRSLYVDCDFGKDEWEEYVEPVKVWKVGDQFILRNNNDLHTVLYVDKNVIFAKASTFDNKQLYYSSFYATFEELIPVEIVRPTP